MHLAYFHWRITYRILECAEGSNWIICFWDHHWTEPFTMKATMLFFFSFSFFITNDLRNLNLIFLFSVAGIPLSASILTTGIVCTFYTSLVSNPNHVKMIYIRLSKPKTVLFNPLQLTISMHILHTVLYTFPKELTRRICLRIKSF